VSSRAHVLGLALLAAGTGCSGFLEPTPERLARLHLPDPMEGKFYRIRLGMDVDTPWLTGHFQGVVIARRGADPRVRAQFFPDLGPKIIDLAASRRRIVGYFPIQNRGVDCALPDESELHPLTFMGATLLEHFAGLTPERIQGLKRTREGWILEVSSVVPDLDTWVSYLPGLGVQARAFEWHFGVGWFQEYREFHESVILAPSIRIGVSVLQEREVPDLDPALFELSLPEGVAVDEGSRK
jgi:hypothetical protein